MSRERLNLLLVAFLGVELESPAAVHLGDQVLALGVVNTVLLPARHQFILEHAGFQAGLNTALSLKVATDQLAHHDTLRWIAHYSFFNY